MNCIYRLVWNAGSRTLVAAAESARGRGKGQGGGLRSLLRAIRRPAGGSGHAGKHDCPCSAATALGAASLLGLALAAPAQAQTPLAPDALPAGGQVIAGQAAIGQSGSQMTVSQASDKAILDWQSFDIGSGAAVNFSQPSSSSVALNRVLAGDASRIEGQLTANGQVWLVNPNGVIFGQGARVDVGGIVASTLDITNEDFLAGKAVFRRNGATGRIENRGAITAAGGGTVALLSPEVTNEGTISARMGRVVLAGGDRVAMDVGADGLLKVSVDPATVRSLIDNRQLIMADGGEVVMTARAAAELGGGVVANNGVIQADRLVERDGRILIEGGDIVHQGELLARGGRIEARADHTTYADGLIDVSSATGRGGSIDIRTGKLEGMAGATLKADGVDGGDIRVEARGMNAFSSTLSAKGGNAGGTIEVTGDSVILLAATLDASGGSGAGGTVHVGGGWQGAGELPQAREVVVGVGSTIKANGASGGEAVLWSTRSTEHYGRVEATGSGGAGGRIEASASEGEVTLQGELQAGAGGQVLLDPKNLIITDTPPSGLTLARRVSANGPDTIDGVPVLTDNESFGSSIALDASRGLLAIGSPQDSIGGLYRGSVSLFTFGAPLNEYGALTWSKKVASAVGASSMPALSDSERFGTSIAISGPVMAVGAEGYNGNRGAVYLFTGVGSDFSGLKYSSTITSVSSILNPNDRLGSAVALDGDAFGGRMAIGARGDLTSGTYQGAAYLFTYTVSGNTITPTEQVKLSSGMGALGMPYLNAMDNFGRSIALKGDLLAVGAPGSDYSGPSGTNRGIVLLFNLVGADFSGLQYVGMLGNSTSPGSGYMGPLAINDYFGSSVALDGDRLAVGAPGADTGGTDRGAVHLFNNVGTDFSGVNRVRVLASGSGATGMPALANNDTFGNAVALSGDLLVVGANGTDSGKGGFHLFNGVGSNFSGLTWKKKISQNSGGFAGPMPLLKNDNFGSSVALDGDRMAIGAWWDDTRGSDTGAVYLFTGVGTDFTGLKLRKKLASSTGATSMPVLASGDYFGSAVALDVDRLAVGASGDDTSCSSGSNCGAVHLFTGVGSDFSGLTWVKKLRSNSGATSMPGLGNNEAFGSAVALDGDRLVVGAPGDSSVITNAGAVHLFTGVGSNFSGLAWQKRVASGVGATSMPGLATGHKFGISVALDGDRLAVGASGDDTGGTDRGAVHLFNGVGSGFSGLTWRKILGSSTGATGMPALANTDEFGRSVALSGDRLVVGAWNYDTPSFSNNGGAFYFDGAGSPNFSGLAYKGLITHDQGYYQAQSNLYFGTSVALDGDRLAVGAKSANLPLTGGGGLGGAYLFTFGSSGTILPAQATFAGGVNPNSYLKPSDITAILNAGTAVTLQASNDITVSSAVVANNPSGAGGKLTLQAGRQINVNAAIDSDDGDLTLVANERLASGVVNADRESGAGGIAVNATLMAGAGNLSLEVRDGAGKTFSTAGNIAINDKLIAKRITVVNSGGADIVLGGGGNQLQASGSGDAIVLAGRNFINNIGATAFTTPSGRWLVWSTNPASDTRNGLAYAFKQYGATYGVSAPAQITGNGFLYSVSPTITAGLTGSVVKTYDGTTDATLAGGNYTVSGAIDGDTVTLNNPAAGSYDNKNAGGSKTVSVSGISIAGATNGAATVYGYTLASSSASGSIGTINKAAITLSTGNVSKTYDGGTSALGTATVTGGTLFGGDSLSGGSFAFTDKNVGSGNKTVTVGAVTVNDGNGGGNYTVSYANNTTSTINPAALDVTASDASKTYDGLAWSGGNGVTYAGFVNGETASVLGGMLSYGGTSQGATNAGSYVITPSGLTSGNYDISYANGALTIGKAALTVTANADSKTYDGVAYSGGNGVGYSGFVNGETAAVLGGSLAWGGSSQGAVNAGSYTIVPSGQTSGNYTITYHDGTLTILPVQMSQTTLAEESIWRAMHQQMTGLHPHVPGFDSPGPCLTADGGQAIPEACAGMQTSLTRDRTALMP